MSVQTKRVYASPAPEDGQRVLVDRLWPRGIAKDRAKLNLWLKDVAPSIALRRKFHGGADDWEAFRAAYAEELQHSPAREAFKQLAELAEEDVVTLVYGAKDELQNNAVVLHDLLKAHSSSR